LDLRFYGASAILCPQAKGDDVKMPKIGGETLKSSIITTAGALFHKNGYEKTTYQMIADELGISKGSISYHFKSKPWIIYFYFFRYVQNMFSYIRENLTDTPNAFLIHCIEQIHFYRQVMKTEENRKLFLNMDHMEIWEQENLFIIKDYFREISRDFHRGMTEEDIHVAAIMSLGAKIGMFREADRYSDALDIDRFCYYFVHMIGLFSRLGEMIIHTNIARAFDFLEKHTIPFDDSL
jgi:AcrR family transcriptional regulator